MGTLQVPKPCHRLLFVRVKTRIYLLSQYLSTAERPKPCRFFFWIKVPFPKAAFPSGPLDHHSHVSEGLPAQHRNVAHGTPRSQPQLLAPRPGATSMGRSPHVPCRPSLTGPVAIHPLGLPLSQPCLPRRHAVFISWSRSRAQGESSKANRTDWVGREGGRYLCCCMLC